jgi:hypothetical protein
MEEKILFFILVAKQNCYVYFKTVEKVTQKVMNKKEKGILNFPASIAVYSFWL